MKIFIVVILSFLMLGCSSKKYDRTVTYVERDKFMGDWYVIAGRFAPAEKEAYNVVENFNWNEKEKRIDISLRFNQGAFNGPLKKIQQKAWIQTPDNAHWKVQPYWPFTFDFLIIGIATDYRWTAIGFPDQKYLWIMCRDQNFTKTEVEFVLGQLKKKGYDTKNITYVSHD